MIHQCYPSSRVSAGQRFRILAQSDCWEEGQAHFCYRRCLPPSISSSFSFQKNDFQDIFSRISDFLAGAINGSILWLHTAIYFGCILLFSKFETVVPWIYSMTKMSAIAYSWMFLLIGRWFACGPQPDFFFIWEFFIIFLWFGYAKFWSYRVLNNNNIHTHVTIELPLDAATSRSVAMKYNLFEIGYTCKYSLYVLHAVEQIRRVFDDNWRLIFISSP